MGNKHYIRLNNNVIIKGFSDAFENPQESDICITEIGGRHFELNGTTNPSLYDGLVHLYKYVDGEVIERTEEELKIDRIAHSINETPIEEILAREIIRLQNELWLVKNQIASI